MKHEKIEIGPAEKGAMGTPGKRLSARMILMTAGPVVVLAAVGYAYLSGGRYVSTDNAYVHATVTPVVAQVSGPVSGISVRDNELVGAGDVLFAVDRAPYEIRLREAEAALDKARSDVAALKASYRQKLREIVLARSDQDFRERDWRRQQNLAANNVVSRAKLDAARHDYDSASQRVDVLHEDLARIAADLGGHPDLPADRYAAVRRMLARRDQARLDLDRSVVRAPIAGRVSEAPSRGQYVMAGQPIFSLVSADDLWVEANFKETELTHMHAGQGAQVAVDTYPDAEWAGQVESIAQATGAVFSVLPAQNASGNWVKVVQRVPVRVALENGDRQPVLRAGMSVEVTVDTGHRRTIGGLVRHALRLVGMRSR